MGTWISHPVRPLGGYLASPATIPVPAIFPSRQRSPGCSIFQTGVSVPVESSHGLSCKSLSPPQTSCSLVIHLHGTSDAVIPYNGNNDYNSAQSAIDYWVDFNNTNSNPILTTDSNGGMTIEHYLYAQGDSSVSVELYKYIGGNHVWFNTTFQGKNASQLIWDFVSRYDINGLR